MGLKTHITTQIVAPANHLQSLKDDWLAYVDPNNLLNYDDLVIDIDQGLFYRKNSNNKWGLYSRIKLPMSVVLVIQDYLALYNNITNRTGVFLVDDLEVYNAWLKEFWEPADYHNEDYYPNEPYFGGNGRTIVRL